MKDLIVAKDQRVIKRTQTQEKIQEIAEMSKVSKNKVFIELSGVPEYRIGPLDALEIYSHNGAEVSLATITVDNRGKISYSFIDDLSVAGLTSSQLDERLTKELSNYIKNPRIDVIVTEFNSKFATALGELAALRVSYASKAASGKIPLQGKTTLMEFIAMAGGYTVDADIKKVKLIRQGKTYLINLYDIIEKGDGSKNVIIDDGDVVDMPALSIYGERVYVMGEVSTQGIYPLKDAQDLLGAIALAGSFTSLAKEENTLIVRGYGQEENGPLVMMADLKALLRKADLTQNITLQDGDLIYIPRMLIGDINEWIVNTTPLLDFLFYPKKYQDAYSTRNYLDISR
ncbi:MAG: polysaccharide biosynthesis/export family protein [Deltaproteobacteria bacterium]|nr:polysaccharide biosynthesis/export family protein [Deltaproteobacteria bacterium]